jgi:flagellar protein FliO/FliZ
MPTTTPTPDPAPPATRRPSPYLVGAGILVIVLGFGLPQLLTDAPASASQPPSAETPSAPAPANLGVALLRLAAGLVVACVLCVVAARYANRKQPRSVGAMEVLATLPVGPRCAVHLVRAGDRRLLVGTDLGGVKSVVELPGPEPEAEARVEPRAIAQPAPAVVVGPVAVAAPMPSPTQEAILTLLARLQSRAQTPPSSPG